MATKKTKTTKPDDAGKATIRIVDPEGSVAVYRRAADGTLPLAITLEAKNAETLTTPLLPGWDLPLERLFSE